MAVIRVFADVVHSMDIAAAVGPERLREIMTDLTDRCAAVVHRTKARSTSSPATGAWRCSAYPWRWCHPANSLAGADHAMP